MISHILRGPKGPLFHHALTPEQRAYIAYCDWCDFLDLTPADRETWRKATKNLSETNYSSLELKRRRGRDVIA